MKAILTILLIGLSLQSCATLNKQFLNPFPRHFPPLFEKIVFSILTTKNIQNFQMEGFHVQDDWLFV